MDEGALGPAELSAALETLEDQIVLNIEACHATAVELERHATALGDERLLVRARLCAAGMLLRTGETATAARQIHALHQWAVTHGDRRLQSRTHMACGNVQRLAGDAAKMLEHALSAVELLDETATPYMQVAHRLRLAESLALNGPVDAARPRFHQTEQLARELEQWELLTVVLNNWAYVEYTGGEFARAEQVAGRLLAHAAAHGFDLDPTALDTIGGIQIENGQYAEAEQTMRLCIARYHAGYSDDADDMAEYLLTLARALRGLGELDQAQASVDSSRDLCTERNLAEVMVRVHQEQAELHAARGDFGAAFAEQKVFFEARENLRSQQREAQAQTRQVMFETAEARQEAEQFREQARRDPLTGLRNRRYVDEELPGLVAADPDLVVAIADVDHFKRINDTLSHDAGDQVLVRVAALLDSGLARVSPGGFVARLGGEEFLLVLPATRVGAATEHLDGIRRAIGDHDWRDIAADLPVTVSIGVAGVNESTPRSQGAALSTADRNLYAAKRAGRNRVVAGTPRERRPRAYRDRGAT
ncbi:diguanylate cyclase (GGDEF)-like protein [Krasilnikovia cinnamomea]|uniref:Diguanylate cyclase (GGDEF)-like protein n=1 Tax=Krasilnikovia cinnamomea TaxID=349313 RepID=A0A4Q7ZF96_9ACTN|nr:GGDEF domain-containing protein [Krasilnikovia cinnamomea]RZU49378.1 diguanylate cyclase (GGDEF)-like protein [Krasilnikovia cinnamomea]